MSKFIRCGVCDYLRHQIDICPREHSEYLNALVKRLGSHYDMQSAQRLAQDKLQEKCDQSGGRAWMIKIDKMDSSAIRCPTRWRLLNTAIFRDGNRVEVGLIGSVWSGLHHSAPIHFAQSVRGLCRAHVITTNRFGDMDR